MEDWPRRSQIQKLTPAELKIRNLVWEIEELGAHPLLTDTVCLLQDARNKLADWIDAGEPGSAKSFLAAQRNASVEEPKDKVYTDNDLVYAAYCRCLCGAGMAHVKNCGAYGPDACWDCSDILTGRAIPEGKEGAVTHKGRLPFTWYEIKSENQPSANGNTTRPGVGERSENTTRPNRTDA